MISQGLLILDAHKTPFDIFRTAVWVSKKYNPKKIHLPIAGYFFYVPILKQLTKYYSSKYNICLYPVYRSFELTTTDLFTRFFYLFYPKYLTSFEKQKKNEKYFSTAIKAIKSKREVVIVSPYGGYINYGKKIMYGVKKLISQTPHIIVAHTKFTTTFQNFNVTNISDKTLDKKLKKAFKSLK